jgi:hypothetical protein
MIRPLLLAAVAAVPLSACVNLSRSAPVTPIAAADSYRVSEVRLAVEPEIETTDEFAGIFAERVQTELNGCADGARPLRLEASISRFDRANPVQVALIGGANVLRGHARLVEPASGRVVGEYEIGRTVIGARVAAFEMAESEEQLSTAFGRELCEQAFPEAEG